MKTNWTKRVSVDSLDKNTIQQLKKILEKKTGNIVYSIYCFGSRITKGNKESDFDILILTQKKLNWRYQREIKNIVYDFGIENELVFDPKVLSIHEFEVKYSFSPFVQSVKTTGIAI